MKTIKNGHHPRPATSYCVPKSFSNDHSDDCLPVPKLSFIPAAVIVFMLGTACFANSCSGDFVFDDTEAILNNADIKSDASLEKLFRHDFWGTKLDSNSSHKSYRPLTVLTFRWNYSFANGLHPWSFHVVNVILHGVVCVLFLKVFSCLLAGNTVSCLKQFPAPKSSFLCALIYSVHPVHTENVAGIVGRADLLCALLVGMSLLCYVQACLSGEEDDAGIPTDFSLPWLLLSTLLIALAMLCKEQGITAIGISSAYDIIVVCQINLFPFHKKKIIQANQNAKNSWWKSLILRQLILLICGLLLLGIRWRLMGSKAPTFQHADNPHSFISNFFLRLVNYSYIYALNFWLLLNPWWLCFDWSMGCVPTIESFVDPRVCVAMLFWTGLFIMILVSITYPVGQYKRILSMAFAILVVPFLPASNLFFRVGFVIAERILYLPSAGFCMLVVTGARMICQFNSGIRKVVASFFVFLIVVYICRSVQRSAEWQTESKLFTKGEKVCPLNAKVHYNIAKVKSDDGEIDFAIERYNLAIKLYPEYDQAMNNLANILKERNMEEEAKELLEKAVQIRPSFAAAWMNLGIVQASMKKYNEALISYTNAIRHRRNYPDCFYNLGNLFLETKQHDLAIQAWRNATILKPTHLSSWSNMIILLDSIDLKTAETACLNAINHLPQESILYLHLGSVLGKMERYKESEQNFLRAIKLMPNNSRYYLNLGILYHRWGKFSEAVTTYKTSLRLDPNQKNAQQYLQTVEKKINRQQL